MKILSIVGARPQFIKAAAVTRAIRAHIDEGITEVLVHTGQHFDKMMSEVFFDDLGIGLPAYNLSISGGRHGEMTGRMLESLEIVMLKEKPDWVLIYGDTNSTLAGALAASKLHIPIAHVEAGLRSFNMDMPEEINRILADRVSTLLLCPTDTAVANLNNEGTFAGVHNVGDVMYDVALIYSEAAESRITLLAQLGVTTNEYVLSTCHRAETTDNREKLQEVLIGLSMIAEWIPVVLPLHPRTKAKIIGSGLNEYLEKIKLIEPVSYLDMVVLEKNAMTIVTDSGGIQKEAFFYRVPCITTRCETEWIETVDSGWNQLVGTDSKKIFEAFESRDIRERKNMSPYGIGNAAEKILNLMYKS
ncbi:non-hydrolyzing UDP-N-acetylglucosamine 2-epimerase [Rheinheimera sp.]|uniref:non-hydrolyzing UDP-N-acetylglucosamine 2-epimerase n=1 Tax=Rheinheimera sp. TaxID=1869214 RepID=UPI004047F3EB